MHVTLNILLVQVTPNIDMLQSLGGQICEIQARNVKRGDVQETMREHKQPSKDRAISQKSVIASFDSLH